MKHYVVQVDPSYQESPLMMDVMCDTWEQFIVVGNDWANSDWYSLYQKAETALDEGSYDISCVGQWNGYSTVTEFMQDCFPPKHKKHYSTKEVKRFKELADAYASCTGHRWFPSHEDMIAEMLSMITGEKFVAHTIHGNYQGDYADVILPEKYEDEIETFKCEYFNLGAEWIVHDGEEEIDEPADISGYSCYTHGWREEDILKELSEIIECKPEDIVLWKHSGYQQISKYERVG